MHKSVGRWVPVLTALAGCWGMDARAQEVDLLWSPSTSVVAVGDTFEVDLIARSSSGSQAFSGLETIMTWDPTVLRLVGNRDEPVSSGGYDWLLSGFPAAQADNLNDTFLDGNALYQGLGQFDPSPLPTATPSGFLVTHMEFEALRASSLTQLSIPTSIGMFTDTIVASADSPGLNILGSTGTANITVVPEPTTAALLAALSTGMLWHRRRGGRMRRQGRPERSA